MKKIIGVLIIALFIFGVGVPQILAAEPSISLDGPSLLRTGQSVRINFSVNGNNNDLIVLIGNIEYDSSQLRFESVNNILSNWAVAVDHSSGNILFLAEDDNDLNSPINSNRILFSINFTVRTSVDEGESIRISTKDIEVSSIEDFYFPTIATFSRTVSPPLSSNNNLNSLTVNNATISPAFAANTTSYTTTVPFEINSLNISASPQDSTARTAISGNSLSVGSNSVSVTVTAENGSTRTYTINVTRQQDPNYLESDNANLSSITPNNGILSPLFDPDITFYHVYLPYEIDSFDATGQAEDAKAREVERESIELVVGDNEFIIKGIAEDGSTKPYTIKVIRMPAIGEEIPEPTPIPTDEPDDTEGYISFSIMGKLLDSENNPLANKILELHSEPIFSRTDNLGNYKFDNVTAGQHTLYVKDLDGTQIGTLSLNIVKGDNTKQNDDELIVSGDVAMDLVLNVSGLQITSFRNFNEISDQDNKSAGGIPIWVLIIIVIASIGVGFFGRHFLPINKYPSNSTDDGKIFF